MELRHLRYFAAVAEEENISRAALRLHVSQPALSRQIRDLEEELGFELLERSARTIRLSPAGKAFFTESRAVLGRLDAGIEAARRAAARGVGELNIGYAPSLTARFLPSALKAFRVRRPEVRVGLHDLSTEEMLSGLRRETLDLAFLVKPLRAMLRGIHFDVLAAEPWCVAVAPSHRLAPRKVARLDEVLREPLLGFSRNGYPEYWERVLSLFRKEKRRLKMAGEHDSVSSLIAAVEAESGIALVSESILCLAGGRVRALRLEPAPEPLEIGAAWMENGSRQDLREFLALALSMAQQMNLSKSRSNSRVKRGAHGKGIAR